jgi:hypothetical protein
LVPSFPASLAAEIFTDISRKASSIRLRDCRSTEQHPEVLRNHCSQQTMQLAWNITWIFPGKTVKTFAQPWPEIAAPFSGFNVRIQEWRMN